MHTTSTKANQACAVQVFGLSEEVSATGDGAGKHSISHDVTQTSSVVLGVEKQVISLEDLDAGMLKATRGP